MESLLEKVAPLFVETDYIEKVDCVKKCKIYVYLVKKSDKVGFLADICIKWADKLDKKSEIQHKKADKLG